MAKWCVVRFFAENPKLHTDYTCHSERICINYMWSADSFGMTSRASGEQIVSFGNSKVKIA